MRELHGFNILTTFPQIDDYIRCYKHGTTDLVSGLKDANDVDIPNPFQVSDVGSIFQWYFKPPSSSELYDIFWVEGNQYLSKGASYLSPDRLSLNLNPQGTANFPIGTTYWEVDDDTITTILAGARLQHGHEMYYNIRNQTGVEITNGTPVMAIGIVPGTTRLLVTPMDGTDKNNARFYLGPVTTDVPDDGNGKATEFGLVRGINTSTWAGGLDLWISSTLLGVFTGTRPPAMDLGMSVAFVVVSDETDGVLMVRSNHTDENLLWGTFYDSGDPTGFVNTNSDINTAYNKVARTVTLTGNLRYRYKGVEYELVAPWTSAPHPVGDGLYFLYSSDGENFVWSTTPWEFHDMMASAVFVLGGDAFAVRETHGLMPWTAHEEFHELLGTYRHAGLGPTAGTYVLQSADNDDIRPAFDSGDIKDEDIITTIPLSAENLYTTMHVGAGGVSVFDTAATFPFREDGDFILVNDPATGAETPAGNGKYLNVYELLVPVGSDVDSQKYRRLLIQPQVEYSTLDGAESESPLAINRGSFNAPEFVFYTRLTYRTGNGYSTNGKVRLESFTLITGSRASQVAVGGVFTPTAENIPFTPPVDMTSVNVQLAIEELDDTSKNTKLEGVTEPISPEVITNPSANQYSFIIDMKYNRHDIDMSALAVGDTITFLLANLKTGRGVQSVVLMLTTGADVGFTIVDAGNMTITKPNANKETHFTQETWDDGGVWREFSRGEF